MPASAQPAGNPLTPSEEDEMTTPQQFEYGYAPKAPFAATLAFSARRPKPKKTWRTTLAHLRGLRR